MGPPGLWGSNGVAFGPYGRLYVAQFLAGQISAVDPATGDVEVVVPPDGPVRSPDDLAFGADGSMYIADLVPGRVWRRGPEGEYGLVSDEVKVPNGITCVGDRLFVNEMRMNGRLLELFPEGGEPVVLTYGLALGNAVQLGPDGAETGAGRVIAVDETDTVTVLAEGLDHPVDVTLDADGRCYVSDDRRGAVLRMTTASRCRSRTASAPPRAWRLTATNSSPWTPPTAGSGRSP